MRGAHPQTDVTSSPLRNEDGVAMLTILMLTVILTVIGIAAISTTTQDLKVAGGEKLRATGVNAAEACMSSAVQIVQQTLQNSAVPAALLGAAANPFIATNAAGLGTAAGQNPIQAEIMGASDKNPDTADFNASGTAPNAVLALTGYSVNMDIDRLYQRPKAGGSLQFAAGYEGTAGGAAGGGIEILYRIDCYAQNTSGVMQVNSRITGVYSCVATGDSCQRKI
jgi:Tfp pilus assembly protein PilX